MTNNNFFCLQKQTTAEFFQILEKLEFIKAANFALCLQVDVTERALKTELESTKLNLHNEIIAKASKTESELLDLDTRINSTNDNLVNQEEQLTKLKV